MEKLRKLTDKISFYGPNQVKKKTGEQLHQFLQESGEKFLLEDGQLIGSVNELLGKGYAVVVDVPSEERAQFSTSPSFLDEEAQLSGTVGYTVVVDVPSEERAQFSTSPSFLDEEAQLSGTVGYTVVVDVPSEERAQFSTSPSFLDEEAQLSGTVGYTVFDDVPSKERVKFSTSPSFLDESGTISDLLETEEKKGDTIGVEVPSATEETSVVSRIKKFHLHSPRRLVVSPLKAYKENKIIKRRKAKRWSEVEESTLRKAVELHGTGNWTFILNSYSHSFPGRIAGDLKDKWRNICIKDNKATKC
ncbi:uncharacterized protein [Medicago truncatula]|uniref:uncharacterized protein isoform X2 n=1 Tax=Medicago truncatula TaxID=3880 RepID=UPI000D2F2AC4|nr:uncharacterized protein LOC112419918 isoform X2 [Medicago truncatula]